MVWNQKTNVTASQNEIHRRILSELLRQESNRRCADCLARGPSWASVNLGVFVCLNCSGIHRSLGVHNSKVRSTNLDTWLPEQVAFVRAMGNARGNAYWEANLPENYFRPADGDMAALRTFISDKYVHRRWAAKNFSEPPCIDNFQTHPFLSKQGKSGPPAPQPCASAPVPGSITSASVGEAADAPSSAAQQLDLLDLQDDVCEPSAISLRTEPSQCSVVVDGAHVSSCDPVAKTTLAVVQSDALDIFSEIQRHTPGSVSLTKHHTASVLNESAIDVYPQPQEAVSAGLLQANPDPFQLPSRISPQGIGNPASLPLSVPPLSMQREASMQTSSSTSSMGSASQLNRKKSAAPMRAACMVSHSRGKDGKYSHEDILAMFDQPKGVATATAATFPG